jgi:hypothetical protein
MISQHQLLGIRMEVNLLVYPVRHRKAVQEVLQERQRHDQRHQPLSVVLAATQELQPTAGRPCLRSTSDSSGSPSCTRSLSVWVRWLITRLLQCHSSPFNEYERPETNRKINNRILGSGEGRTFPCPGWVKPARYVWNRVGTGKTASVANRRQERRHHLMQSAALGHGGCDEAG